VLGGGVDAATVWPSYAPARRPPCTRPIHATTLTCVIAKGEWNSGYVPFKRTGNGQAELGESEKNTKTHARFERAHALFTQPRSLVLSPKGSGTVATCCSNRWGGIARPETDGKWPGRTWRKRKRKPTLVSNVHTPHSRNHALLCYSRRGGEPWLRVAQTDGVGWRGWTRKAQRRAA